MRSADRYVYAGGRLCAPILDERGIWVMGPSTALVRFLDDGTVWIVTRQRLRPVAEEAA